MQKYSNNLIEIFYNSSYSGAISGADVIVKNDNAESGEVVKTYLVVRDGLLKDCSFQAMGSIALYASLTTMCALSKGKALNEILNISEKDIINEIKQLNKQEYGEVVFALDSFKKAVLTYMKRKNLGTIIERPNQKMKITAPSKNVTRYGEVKSRVSQIESIMQQQEREEVETLPAQGKTAKVKKVEEKKPVQSPVVKEVVKEIKAQPAKKEVKTQSEKKVEQKVVEKKEVKKETAINKNEKKLDALISEVKLEEVKPQKKIEQEQDSELLIVPVGGKKKSKKADKSNIVIPTKIEVRVVEEEKKKKAPQKKEKTEKEPKAKATSKENPYLIKPEPKEVVDEEVIDEIDSITEQLTNAISQLNFKFDDEEK